MVREEGKNPKSIPGPALISPESPPSVSPNSSNLLPVQHLPTREHFYFIYKKSKEMPNSSTLALLQVVQKFKINT